MPATISRRLPASPALPLSHSTKRSARPFHPNHPNRPHRYDHLPTTTPPRPSAASAAPFIIPRAIFTLCNGRAWHHLRWRWLVTRPGSIRRVSHDASSSSSCRSSDGGRHWGAALPSSVERALHRNPPAGSESLSASESIPAAAFGRFSHRRRPNSVSPSIPIPIPTATPIRAPGNGDFVCKAR